MAIEEITRIEPKSFDDFYNRVKTKVINILKEQEIAEGDICFEKIVGDVLKEMIFTDGDIQRKQIVPRDTQNYPSKNIIYRTDSKTKLNTTRLSIR